MTDNDLRRAFEAWWNETTEPFPDDYRLGREAFLAGHRLALSSPQPAWGGTRGGIKNLVLNAMSVGIDEFRTETHEQIAASTTDAILALQPPAPLPRFDNGDARLGEGYSSPPPAMSLSEGMEKALLSEVSRLYLGADLKAALRDLAATVDRLSKR